MRASKLFLSSAAAAAVLSVIGLVYAELSVTADTAQQDDSARVEAVADANAASVATDTAVR